MKKIALIAMTAAAAIATPAMAQNVTGTINITGTVGAKCYVGSNPDGSTFGTTVALEELANPDGTLKDSGTLATKFGTAGGSGLTAKVVCNGAAPNVTVTADPLKNAAIADANVPEGYNNTVNYKAAVTFTLATGVATVNDVSGGAGTAQSLASGLSTTATTNVSVATSDWVAPGVLIAGAYAGKITILIKPAA